MPIAAKFGNPFRLVTAIELGGFEGPRWSESERINFPAFLRAALNKIAFAGQNPEEVLKTIESLKDASRDTAGIKIDSRQTTAETAVILQIDASSLDVKDKESVATRLARLPAGSVVIEYVEKGRAGSASVLSSLIRNFPQLHYFRKTYEGKIPLAMLLQELNRSAKDFRIDAQNAGVLLSNMERLEMGTQAAKVKDLGIIFEFDPARLPNQFRVLKGLSASIFGRLAEYARLNQEMRNWILSQDQANGLLGFSGIAYTLNINLWLEYRASQFIYSAA